MDDLKATKEFYMTLDTANEVNEGDIVTIKCVVRGVEKMPEYNYETDSYNYPAKITALLYPTEIVFEKKAGGGAA